jgi:ribonuclease J
MSASAIPGNENAIGTVVNELYRKGAEVVNERKLDLHVSGHACQQELSILHALVRPKFFVPVHGEQRMLKLHARLAQRMGMKPDHILISEIGKVMEFTRDSAKITGTVPSGKVLVDGYGVGDVGSVVLRDRKHLAEDGVIIVVMTMSSHEGRLVCGPDIVTRGFVYVKDAEDLMEAMKYVVNDTLDRCRSKRIRDHATIKAAIKNVLPDYRPEVCDSIVFNKLNQAIAAKQAERKGV